MFKKILVPQDITDIAERPVELALELARQGGGRVTLLSVIDDSFPNPDILSFQMPWADYYRHLREEAETRLDALQKKLGGGRAEVVVVRGKPATAIVSFAEEEGFDLIVMGTHSPRGLRHAIMGSVARRVIHDAPCPVLVARYPQEDED